MGILYEGGNAILTQSSGAVPGNPIGALRDWNGHETAAYTIASARDYTWSGSSHVATGNLSGPYDIDTAIEYESGSDSLNGNYIYSTSTDEKLEIAAWVKFDNVPTPGGSNFEQSFIVFDVNGSNGYLEVTFIFRTDNTVGLKAAFSNDGITEYSATHVDNMARTGWTFFAVQFDHTAVGNTIYIDPGNDNLIGYNPGPAISATSYDEHRILEGSGQSPGNVKGVQFTDVLIIRDPPPSGEETEVEFTLDGNNIWQVPSGVTEITVAMWGSGGGGGGGGSQSVGGNGAGAGFTKATHTTTPLENLTVVIGTAGSFGTGGAVSGSGGGGGGRCGLVRGVTDLQTSGGGAGGGGGDNSSFVAGGNGGVGGANTGGTGTASGAAQPGTGGTQVAGGAGGTGNVQGQAGALHQGGGGGDGEGGTTGSTGNGGSPGGGGGGTQSSITLGFGGGGGGGDGHYGGGGGGSSTFNNAGGGGGGGGSNYIEPGATTITNAAGSGTTPGGTGDPLYVAGYGGGGSGGGISTQGTAGTSARAVIVYADAPESWRETVRGFTTQEEFDEYFVETIKAVRYYRCSEWDTNGTVGDDRFIHDISGFLNPGLFTGGTLDRNLGVGPLDANNSYSYRGGCSVTTTNPVKSLWYPPFSKWDLTWFCFFRQPASVTNDNDWFIRFENDAGEYLQLERDGLDLKRVVQLATGGPITDTSNSTPLFDGSWHRLVMTASDATAANWDVAVDGTRYFPDVTPQALSAPMERVRWGNIDIDIAVMGWANYFDAEIYTTFTSQGTLAAVADYIEARTDAPDGQSTSEYYAGYYPQQVSETGDA